MSTITNILNKISINKLSKKTLFCIGIISLEFTNNIKSINMIIQLLLLTIVFIIVQMLLNSPHQLDLENYILKNCIGMLSIITLLRKTSFIAMPDSIIKSINSFITNTNSLAENLMDGVNPNKNQNIETNLILDQNQNQNQNQILTNTIIKNILTSFVSTL